MRIRMKATFYTKATIIFIISALALVLVMPDSALASPQLFGLSSDPFIGLPKDIQPCYVDKANILFNSINSKIKEDQNFDSSKYKEDFDGLSKAYLCCYQAEMLGITKLPAIVFNDKYVVYGDDDLQSAKRKYENYKEKHHA